MKKIMIVCIGWPYIGPAGSGFSIMLDLPILLAGLFEHRLLGEC